MHIHYIQHEEKENCGSIKNWTEKMGYKLTRTRLFAGEQLPHHTDFDLLIVLGGSMDVLEQEKYPWLAEEITFLKEKIEQGVKVIGICLGAQLIAASMGARVKKCPHKEVGWFPLRLTRTGIQSNLFSGIPEKFLAMHWHEYTFDLTPDAFSLAESDACKNQAVLFRKNALALQFHLEFMQEMMKEMLSDSPDHRDQKYVQSPAEIHCVSKQQFTEANALLEKILNRFLLES